MTAVLWLDGAFGAGKTTTAERILRRRPEWLLLDPELVGALLWEHDPSLRGQDFRALRLWRRLVVEHVHAVQEERGRSLVVPMSLFDPVHVDETVGELSRRGLDVHHVRLVVDGRELTRRILAQRTSQDADTDAGTRAFRLAQLDVGLAATLGHPVPVDGRSAAEVAAAVLATTGL